MEPENNIFSDEKFRIGAEHRIRAFIKFVDSKWASNIIETGQIFMRTIKYFRDFDDSNNALRGDPHEGLSASYRPELITLKFGDIEITDAIDKVDIRESAIDDVFIYSMAIVTDKDILDAGPNGLYLSPRFLEFGDTAIAFLGENAAHFRSRLTSTIEKEVNLKSVNKNGIVARHVEYLNRENHHGPMTIFNKFEEFSWQREWRIALLNKHVKDPPELYIGDVSSICHKFSTADIIKFPLKFHFPTH